MMLNHNRPLAVVRSRPQRCDDGVEYFRVVVLRRGSRGRTTHHLYVAQWRNGWGQWVAASTRHESTPDRRRHVVFGPVERMIEQIAGLATAPGRLLIGVGDPGDVERQMNGRKRAKLVDGAWTGTRVIPAANADPDEVAVLAEEAGTLPVAVWLCVQGAVASWPWHQAAPNLVPSAREWMTVPGLDLLVFVE